jgi:hypothetical protein
VCARRRYSTGTCAPGLVTLSLESFQTRFIFRFNDGRDMSFYSMFIEKLMW